MRFRLLKRLVMIVAVTVISLMLRTDSDAAIYWEDSFEAPTNLDNWIFSALGNPVVTTAQHFDGTQSVWGHYTGKDSGNGMFRYYPITEEVWVRFYYRTTNFTYDAVGTKHIYMASNDGGYPNFWLNTDASNREFRPIAQVPAQDCGLGPYDSCVYNPNIAHIPIADDRWYCIEQHLKMNTPGVANGIVELWVDGVQTVGYTNALLRGTAVNGTNRNSSQAYFQFVEIYVQHGDGEMFYDQFAVGNTRIPCIGSTPGQQPSPPTGTRLQ